MGAGGSVAPKAHSFHSVFMDDELTSELEQLSHDSILRASLVEFIKGGAWIDKLAVFEDLDAHCSSGGVWGKFGYDPPAHGESPMKSLSTATSNQTLNTLLTAGSQNSFGEDAALLIDASNWVLCNYDAGLRAVLFLTVLPFFLKSKEYRSSKYQLNISSGPSSPSESIPRTSCDDGSTRKGTRLRELLHTAATRFDSADLEEYLELSSADLVPTFQAVIDKLPIALTIMHVDKLDGKPYTMFENSSKLSAKSTSSRSVSFKDSAKESVASFKGLSVRATRETEYSPEQRELVQRAMEERRALKIAVPTANGQCILRALKPVYDEDGCFQYMISLESVEKIYIADTFNPAYSAQAFQQIDDALLLLPLLIKTE